MHSALNLPFLDLSDFPKYVVHRSEFSSNLWYLIFLIKFICIHLDLLPLIYLVLGQNLILSYFFFHLHLSDFCKY